jgi:hypothetical protein
MTTTEVQYRLFTADDLRTIVLRRDAVKAPFATIALDYGVSADSICDLYKLYKKEQALKEPQPIFPVTALQSSSPAWRPRVPILKPISGSK